MAKKFIEDKRSKKIVLLPFCVLCQVFQAEGIVNGEWTSSITPIIEFLNNESINIIQMPCPESSYNGYEKGLSRKPAGLKYYDTGEYRDHCHEIALKQYEIISACNKKGYQIVSILGIELSSSCACNYIYSNKGMQRRRGIFLEEIHQMCTQNNLNIPLIGINRKNTSKAILELEKILK